MQLEIALTLLLYAPVPLTGPAGTAAAKEQPPPYAGLAADALCGADNAERPRAEALDLADAASLPKEWRGLTMSRFTAWMQAPPCAGQPAVGAARTERRRRLLEQYQMRLLRAEDTATVEALLVALREWSAASDEWPAECRSCAELRDAAEALVTASRKAKESAEAPTQLGSILDAASQREALIGEICAVRPSLAAWPDIEKRFRYYSWTPAGARLLQVAKWYARREVTAVCNHK